MHQLFAAFLMHFGRPDRFAPGGACSACARRGVAVAFRDVGARPTAGGPGVFFRPARFA